MYLKLGLEESKDGSGNDASNATSIDTQNCYHLPLLENRCHLLRDVGNGYLEKGFIREI